MGIDISCILRYDMHSTGVKKAATLRRSSEILNIGFGELIVVLLVKPSGLLGKYVPEKV